MKSTAFWLLLGSTIFARFFLLTVSPLHTASWQLEQKDSAREMERALRCAIRYSQAVFRPDNAERHSVSQASACSCILFGILQILIACAPRAWQESGAALQGHPQMARDAELTHIYPAAPILPMHSRTSRLTLVSSAQSAYPCLQKRHAPSSDPLQKLFAASNIVRQNHREESAR